MKMFNLPLFKDTFQTRDNPIDTKMSEKEKSQFNKISQWLFPELYEDGKRKSLLSEEIEFVEFFK